MPRISMYKQELTRKVQPYKSISDYPLLTNDKRFRTQFENRFRSIINRSTFFMFLRVVIINVDVFTCIQ